MRTARQLLFALTIGLAFGPGAAADTTSNAPGASAGVCLGTFTTSVTSHCNCTGQPLQVDLMHAEQVDLEVGGDVITVSTGFANCDPVPVTIAPGECATLCYSMTLIQFCGFFFCTFEVGRMEVTVKREPVTCARPSTPKRPLATPPVIGMGPTGPAGPNSPAGRQARRVEGPWVFSALVNAPIETSRAFR